MPEGETLRIEPGAAERIARAFDTHAENLMQIADRLRNSSYSTGFAGFPSAVELDAGFTKKAKDAVAHLQSQVEMTRRCAAEIRAAGTRYTETDLTNSAVIRNTGDGITADTGHR